MESLQQVEVVKDRGLTGDRYRGKPGGKRQVTLIQYEHLEAVGRILGREPIDPWLTRRNIVVRGINLQSLRRRQFRIGSAVLYGTGLAHPCSKMEEMLGPGGYAAMIGHGGLTTSILQSGQISLGNSVCMLSDDELFDVENA
ncbi:MAG: MOSC domain-containing protein [Pirellulaceae bacterium]